MILATKQGQKGMAQPYTNPSPGAADVMRGDDNFLDDDVKDGE